MELEARRETIRFVWAWSLSWKNEPSLLYIWNEPDRQNKELKVFRGNFICDKVLTIEDSTKDFVRTT